jgi:hypothetical protein
MRGRGSEQNAFDHLFSKQNPEGQREREGPGEDNRKMAGPGRGLRNTLSVTVLCPS